MDLRPRHAAHIIYLILDNPREVHLLLIQWLGTRPGGVRHQGRGSRPRRHAVRPGLVWQVLKKYYAGPVLNAAKSLPFVGKHLLQRNVIKFAIPGVGIPLIILVNRHTTVAAGRHAQSVFRNEAEVIELAGTLIRRTRHPRLMLPVAWLVINADGKITDAESLLFQQLTRLARERHQVNDEQLANVVNIDPAEVWHRIDAEPGNLSDVVHAAERVATVDGDRNAHEKAVIDELRNRCQRR